MIAPFRSSLDWFRTRFSPFRFATFFAAVMLFVFLVQIDESDARKKRRRHGPPPLQIMDVHFSDNPYVAGNGILDMELKISLPKEVDPSTILEVSLLLSSPSKRHFRFLSARTSIEEQLNIPSLEEVHSSQAASTGAPRASGKKSTMYVVLSWDGTDQYRQLVTGGRYDFVARAKLLEMTEEGTRTKMVSWKKKGTLQVGNAKP